MTGADEDPQEEQQEERSSWTPVDLGDYLDGTYVPTEPTIMPRSDGPAMFYAGKLHSVMGEAEALKTWTLLVAAGIELQAGRTVTYVDFEDSPEAVVGRLRLLGVPAADIGARFRYCRPEEPLFASRGGSGPVLRPKPVVDYAEMCEGASLVVVDGVSEGMALHGLNISDTSDVAAFYTYAGRVPTRGGAAVSFIDHIPHTSKEQTGKEGRAIGSQHKIAGLDVAYSVTMHQPFGVGLTGTASVKVVKDRPGQVRRHCTGEKHRDFGLLTLSSSPSGTCIRWTLTKPSAGTFRPTMYMERVSRSLEGADKPLPLRKVRENTTGKGVRVDQALEVLVDEKYVEHNSDGYLSVRPYREIDDLMRAQSEGHTPFGDDDDDDD